METNYRIIDAHCHIYPDGIALKAVEAVDRFYDGLPADHYDGTVDTLIGSGSAAGISRFVVHSVATKPHQVSSINHFIAQSAENAGGAFIGMGTMHLGSDDLRRDFEEIVALGLHGVKLHPDIQRFDVDESRAMAIYEMCADAGLPVLVHTGDYRYDYSNPPRVENILRAFPKLKFIGAHFGGWSVWEEASRRLSDYPNIVVDSSSSFYALKPATVRELIRIWGTDRVMFGTDYPLWPQQRDIDYLLGLELGDEDYRKIFWNNAASLFRLEEDAKL